MSEEAPVLQPLALFTEDEIHTEAVRLFKIYVKAFWAQLSPPKGPVFNIERQTDESIRGWRAVGLASLKAQHTAKYPKPAA